MEVKCRKKPIIIRAQEWLPSAFATPDLLPDYVKFEVREDGTTRYFIICQEGNEANLKQGDWIMFGIHGEIYPCDHDIFVQTYDIVDDDGNILPYHFATREKFQAAKEASIEHLGPALARLDD